MAAPLIEASIEKIHNLIVEGVLQPGSRLLPEHELAIMLGSSRNTTREAVRALVMAGVLDVRRGDGTYVTSLKPELLLQGISFVADLLQDDGVLELLEIRRLLEPAATAMAAQRATPVQLRSIRYVMEEMRDSAGDVEALVAHDVRFHELVNRSSGNQTIASVLIGLSGRTFRARVWRAVIEEGVAATTVSQHEQIISAIDARDPALAEASALLHVVTTEAWFRKLVQRRAPITPHLPTPKQRAARETRQDRPVAVNGCEHGVNAADTTTVP